MRVINDYYEGQSTLTSYPFVPKTAGGTSYSIGLGYESQVYSEGNAFHYTGPGASPTAAVDVFNATRFYDEGSWYKGEPIDLNAIASAQYDAMAAAAPEPKPAWATAGFTASVDWNPADVYAYQPLTTFDAVKHHARFSTGAGILTVDSP